jgi:hypothetical protein
MNDQERLQVLLTSLQQLDGLDEEDVSEVLVCYTLGV